jgi:DNA polymerase-3 subunit gamma/tau
MMYRFGDATPFPLNENFIETISAATDCCVALFEADVEAEERRRKVEAIKKHADEEIKRLNVLGRAVEASLRPMLPDGKAERTSEATASKIAQATRSSVKNARLGVERRRDAAVRAAMGHLLSDQIYAALSTLLLDRQVPKSQWISRWLWDNERGAPQIVLKSVAKNAYLEADYSCELPDGHLFTGPVKVASLTPNLSIELLDDGGLFRSKRKLRNKALHRYYITEAELSPERSSFVLRQTFKKPSPGYLIVMREEDQALPKITKIDAGGTAEGGALTLSGDSAVALGTLWEQIEHALGDVRRYRDAVLSASFHESPIERCDDPAYLAESILDTLAPYVREMRLRSRVPGELILKLDRGDGKREELFVPRAQIEAKFSVLPDEHRRYFESVGLSSEATCEFVGREFPLAAQSKSPPPTPPRRAARGSTPPPPRKPTMSSLPDLPVPPAPPQPKPFDDDDAVPEEPTLPVPPEKSGKIRADTDAVTITA